MIHAGVMRLVYHDPALPVVAHSFRPALVGLWHLPGKQINSVRGELLNATGHVGHIQVVVCVHRDGAWFVQFTHTRSAMADNLDLAEDRALNWSIIRRV